MLAKLIGLKTVLALLAALFIGVGATPASAARNGLDAFARDMDRAGRNFCRTFKLRCKPTRSATLRKRKTKSVAALPAPTKPVKTAAATPAAAVAPAAPVVKIAPVAPAAPAGAVSVSVKAPPEKPAAKTDAPVELAPAPKIAERIAPEKTVEKNVTVIVPSAAEPPAPKVDMKLASLEPPVKSDAKLAAEPPKKKKKEAKAPIPKPKDVKVAAIAPSVLPLPSADDACLAALRNSKVEFERVAQPPSEKNCAVATPVQLSSVMTKTGKVTLPDQPVLSCAFARQFAMWLSDTGAATVVTQLNTKLAKVRTGPGFECRSRNGDGSGKLSEHAFGNAVDITTITTADGTKYEVADAIDGDSASQPVLRGLRRSACGYFSTVLGPGANAAHASHFHFDMATNGRGKNYRICQ